MTADPGQGKKQPLLVLQVLKTKPAALGCNGTEKTVLAQMVECLRPEQNGTLIWPGQEYIWEQTGLGERTVRRCIKSLIDLDLIKVHQRTARLTKYSVNVGLIHRLYKTGQSGRSESCDRPERPVTPATLAGLTGQSGRSIEQPTEQPTDQPIPSIGCSSNSKMVDDPIQRRLALPGVVASLATSLRSPAQEQPTGEKSERRSLAVGARAPKERPD